MKTIPSLKEFDLIIQGISNEDKIGHLFMVDIEFDLKNANEKQLFSNEIYTPILERKKKTVLSANKTSVFQLLDAMRLDDKGTINSYKTTAKTHTTINKKFAIPLYGEHLHFLLSRYGWRVSNVWAHFTFEQSKFKKEFVIMNQVSRQNTKTDVEKDFYKLINNSNFGYDCQNNAGNYFFHSTYDEIEELWYAKWYQHVFDQDISEFVSSEILEQQIEEEFLNKIPSLDPNDECYEARKNSFELKKKRARLGVFHEKI